MGQQEISVQGAFRRKVYIVTVPGVNPIMGVIRAKGLLLLAWINLNPGTDK